jgi:transposase
MDSRYDGLQKIIDEALSAMAAEAGPGFLPEKANLAEFCRRTGLTRSKARTLRKKGFQAGPHGNAGRKAETTVLTGYTGVVDDQLRKGVTNSQAIFDRLKGQGYAGGITSVKDYIAAHRSLVPAPRRQADSRGPRGRRYQTEPGEAYQMDWGFANAEAADGTVSRIACFAMACHHCGTPYIEFFPNARQENLFIGMLHGFMELGIPDWVLTDNMKSVIVRRDADGNPVWQKDYEAFMDSIGFRTRLCRPRHPWTKGKVERLIRFVKESFLQGREFTDITQLNEEARRWCREQSGRWRRAAACVPADEHRDACMQHARPFALTEEAERWLCPKRKISFDGFVSYEGRRFGVPLWYARRECRVEREGRVLHIYSDDLSQELVAHPVTWDWHDSCCEGQWTDDGGPAEQPTQPPAPTVRQPAAPAEDPAFARFDFGRRA